MLDSNTITRIARLSRIALAENEREHFAREVSGILGWIEQLGQVNTGGVAPMTSVSEAALPWREDKITDGSQQEAVLANAPESGYGCFSVPKVLE